MFSSHSFCVLSGQNLPRLHLVFIPNEFSSLGVLCDSYFIHRWKLFTFPSSSRDFWSSKDKHSTWLIRIWYVIFCKSFFFVFRWGFPFPPFWNSVILNSSITLPPQDALDLWVNSGKQQGCDLVVKSQREELAITLQSLVHHLGKRVLCFAGMQIASGLL